MKLVGTVLLVIGFLCVVPIAMSTSGKTFALGVDEEGKLKPQGPTIKNIERKTWHIRMFQLGAVLAVIGGVLLWMSKE